MSEALPITYLARHGETEWSLSGRHTGLTDLPLTTRGEKDARELGVRLSQLDISRVFTSPLQRASRTCALAGFGDRAEVDRDLVEWDYGEYEGRTTREIRLSRPGWSLFRDGCPGGETLARNRGAGGPRRATRARRARQCPAVLFRPFPARARGALARPGSRVGTTVRPWHHRVVRARLRARPFGTGDPPVEPGRPRRSVTHVVLEYDLTALHGARSRPRRRHAPPTSDR